MSDVQIAIRRPTDLDINCITSNWLKSYRDGYLVQGVPNRVYFNQHHKILEKLIPRSLVLLAVNAEDAQQIFGWICAEVWDRHLVVHYVYVKDSFRQFGIASRLVRLLLETQDVAKDRILVDHMTWKAHKIIKGNTEWGLESMVKRHGIEVIYNPYSLFYSLPESWEQD